MVKGTLYKYSDCILAGMHKEEYMNSADGFCEMWLSKMSPFLVKSQFVLCKTEIYLCKAIPISILQIYGIV